MNKTALREWLASRLDALADRVRPSYEPLSPEQLAGMQGLRNAVTAAVLLHRLDGVEPRIHLSKKDG